mgnify:CR=1 FL=1
MINLIATDTENTFQNLETPMMDCKEINDKFNYYSEDKKIDFHLINYDPKMYVNLGDLVTPDEVNDIINNKP